METGYEIKLNMADEAKVKHLERKIAVARKELNKLRSDMNSMKKMFVHKCKQVKEMVETGEVPQNFSQTLQFHAPDRHDRT